MRLFFLIVFISLICVQSTQGIITMLNWKINQTEIADKLCENKDKPKLKCNGKCQLAKKLKTQEEDSSSKKSTSKVKKHIEYNFTTEVVNLFEAKLPLKETKQSFFKYSDNISYKQINACFHPPQLV